MVGLVVGTKSQDEAMPVSTREHLAHFWTLIDGNLNTVLFVLIGLEVVRVDFSIGIFAAALLTIAITLAVQAISVAAPLNLIGTVLALPRGSWQLLTWAGLRGGVSVALALCITFDARTVFQQHRPRWLRKGSSRFTRASFRVARRDKALRGAACRARPCAGEPGRSAPLS